VSRYIRILNDIKSKIHLLALTPSQISCRARIEERLAYPGVVNLYGLHGVGKTVLGWAMAADARVVYLVHPSQMRESLLADNPVVFVDNANADRIAFRRLLGALESAGIEKATVVTHQPADEYVFRAELGLTAEDVETVRKNLRSLGYPAVGDDWTNLWHGLLQAAREER
jgi:hypothetical protein